MRNDSPLAVFWRRKSIIVGVFLAFVVTTAVISKTLDKVYSAKSTLLIALPKNQQTFDSVQASQALARSYAEIIDSPRISRMVADDLAIRGIRKEPTDLGKHSDFEPIPETQLLKITAEDRNATVASEMANSYARVFTDYVENPGKSDLKENTGASVTVADEATAPRSPARPKPTLYVTLASILGLALGLALAFLRDHLDHRLRTSHDVESQFDKPVLARVPRRGRSETSISAFREAHRVLRTNLQFAAGETRLRSVVVTSGREEEGKTTTVTQLALASAEVGLRVLVVEGDFRRPGLQRELMKDREEPLRPGFSNYLVEAASLNEVIFPTGRPNIDIVPAGPLPPSPSALLESRRGQRAVSDFLTEADFVIVDCPPLNIGADASVVSGWVDGVIVVVDLGTSTDQTVRDALRQLDAVQANVLGLVLNRDRSAEPSSYDYYLTAGPGAPEKVTKRSEKRTDGGRKAARDRELTRD
jgi:polysaccharide biosynthesis transport protein